MMRFRLLIISLCFCLIRFSIAEAQIIETALNADWRFARCDGKCNVQKLSFLEAIVPGSVYSDLLNNHQISSAFELGGEAEFHLLEYSNWIYETHPFDVPEEIYRLGEVCLRFKGIDTYAVIELNGKQILKVNNAHRQWKVDVKQHIKRNGNILRITLLSTSNEALRFLKSLNYPIPGDSLRAVVRTSQFHFGWDWAPRILSCGITHPIEWVAYENALVTDCYVEQVKVNESLAQLNFLLSGLARDSGSVRAVVECVGSGQQWSRNEYVRDSLWQMKIPAEIISPVLWWSNGLGNPGITEFRCRVFFNDDLILDRICKTGLRSLVLKTADSSGDNSFYFELNGLSVFAKGANYIPLHYFKADSDFEDYNDFLIRCRDANINMIRVWGGGYYEDDVFYDLCDQYGIMVWHDFMFACTMYPGENTFIRNLISEAEEQVVRLRNHPCMALWCGNNEVSEGWHRWGWKDALTMAQQDSLEQAYDRIFLNVLPEIVMKYSTISYHPSSPQFGRGDPQSLIEGDMHDWGIWHDELPLEALALRTPRFMSEFGVQSFPSMEVLQMISKKPFIETDSSFMYHQRHPRGFRLMRDYVNRWYPEGSALDDRKYAYLTQAVQAEGIVNAINHHRVSQPYCMGTLFWQLNDLWPSFSWSALDYAKNEKLLFKMLQEAYAPQTLVALIEDDSLQVYWVSDKPCDRDSAVLYLRMNRPGDSLDQRPVRAMDFETQGYPCRLQPGVKLIYKEALADRMGSSKNVLLDDWTLDSAIEIVGQEGFVVERKFRLKPGSRLMIVPDIEEVAAAGKNRTEIIRRQVFRKL